MGTRGAVGLKVNSKYKIAYNHFDSYPDGLGQEVVDWIKTVMDWETLKERAKKVKMVNERTHKAKPEHIEKYKGYANTTVDDGQLNNWYVLLRDIQGIDTFEEIYRGNLEHMIDAYDFLKDSLFCEYAYILNLNEHTLEIYEGYQKEPQKGNPFGEEPDKNGYYPVKPLKLPVG